MRIGIVTRIYIVFMFYRTIRRIKEAIVDDLNVKVFALIRQDRQQIL